MNRLKISVMLGCVLGTVGVAHAELINRWDFNDAAGTPTQSVASTGPGNISFSNSNPSFLSTDGAGNLAVSPSGDQFINGTGAGFSSSTGQFELLFELSSMTRVDNVSTGWVLRQSAPINNFVQISFRANNAGDGLRILGQFPTNAQLFDYGTGVNAIDNVIIRAVLTLNDTDPGSVEVFGTDDNVDFGSGVGVEHSFGTFATPAGVTLDTLRTFAQSFSTGESAAYDYVQISVVPEPSSMVLSALGAALIGFRKRGER